MDTPLIPQEVYLLERYSSLEYFGRMRDSFSAMVKAAENALAEFMRHLPANYRNQPQFNQPDIAWGERIIPNLQWTLAGLNDGFIQLSRGDADALGMAGNVQTAFSAIIRDYTSEWMPQPYLNEFEKYWQETARPKSNIRHTQQGNWEIYDLSRRFSEDDRGFLDAPATWPIYRINPEVQVKTRDKVPQNGVYLPNLPNSCAEFLIKGYEAWDANVQPTPNELTESGSFKNPTIRQACTWTLIERVADSGGGTGCGPQGETGGAKRRPNIPAGQSCPETGWWFTPAQANSRRYFKQGETMPSVGGDYGQTFWQWSPNQSAPML